MSLSDHVLRRRARYWFRVRVPIDLIGAFGRKEFWRALGTTDPVEAKRRGREMATRVTSLWNQLRSDPMLSKDQIDQLVRTYFDLYLEQDQVQRYSDKANVDWRNNDILKAALALPGMTLEDLNRPEALRRNGAIHGIGLTIDEIEADLAASGKETVDVILDRFNWITHVCMQTALKTNDWREAELFADAYIATERLPIEKNSEDYRRLCFGLLRAIFDATGIILGRSKGDWSHRPNDPLFSAPPSLPAGTNAAQLAARPTAAPPPLSELVEKLLTEKKDITEKFKGDHRAAVRAYEQVLDERSAWHLADIRDVARFKDALLETPTNWRKRFPGKTILESVELNKKRQLATLSPKTINEKYLRILNAVLRWAKQNGYADKNPAAGVRVESTKQSRQRKPRHPFSRAQLKTIFRAPLFTGCASGTKIGEPGSHQVRDHRFWVPLIGLFSGARANEIGQLRKCDVVRVEGISCFRLSDHQLKSDAASRLLPIHPTLIALGVVDLASAAGVDSTARLFPDWGMGGDGYYSSTFSKWFARFLTSIGLDDKKLVFHSFRHNFKDALREAAVPEELQNRLMGHTSGHVGEIYGHGHSAASLAAAVGKITFGDIDFDGMMPQVK